MSDDFKNPTLDECRRVYSDLTHDELVREHCRVLNLFHEEIEMTQRVGAMDARISRDLRSELREAREEIQRLRKATGEES